MQQTDNTELVERLCRAIAKERGVDPDEQIDVFGNKAWSWYVEDGNAIIPIIAEREAAARAAGAADMQSRATQLVQKRMDDRFDEHGTREPDTYATYYSGRYGETLETLDEEDEAIRDAIAALEP